MGFVVNDATRNNIINDICDLIRIPSIKAESRGEGAPFGEDVRKCLETVLDKGATLGFKTNNMNGYIGEMDMGTGEHIIGLLCHSDVVPAGDGWNTNPFEPVLVGNRLYGRGSSDDKGPLVLCMYLVKQLADSGSIPEDVTIRIIVGADEEDEWQDIKYYVENKAELPEYSISPDGIFPLINCEKGLYDVDFVHDNFNENADIILRAISGGVARNAVPSKASVRLEIKGSIIGNITETYITNIARELGIDAEASVEENVVKITVNGKSAHAMNPEKGVNAVSKMIILLKELVNRLNNSFSHKAFVFDYCKHIGMDTTGEKSGFACSDVESGALTLNIGTVSMSDGSIRLCTSIRYPASMDFGSIQKMVAEGFAGSDFIAEYIDWMKPIYFPVDNPLIKALMEVYREKTGDIKAEPIAIGGATYARALPNTVAMGPIFPDEEELAHEPNEFIDLDRLILSGDILYTALEKLIEMVTK